ncbi:MAG TPA: hypothetical protein VFI70_03630, partial [Nitrososphaeraceae archaeon]|nr:hypothetical protein [Nitrososphaeraceae archaeon]
AASMSFISGTGIKIALAQVNPMVPAKDQGGGNTTSMSMSNMAMSTSGGTVNKTTVARDSQTILLEGKIIPAKGFVHLYDSTSYMMNAGHVALHIPCDASSKPVVNTLIGQAPNFEIVRPDLIKELSQPGNICLYHVDISSDPAKKVYQTDIAIQKPTNQTITFPPSSTVVIGVNEIQPGVPGG